MSRRLFNFGSWCASCVLTSAVLLLVLGALRGCA